MTVTSQILEPAPALDTNGDRRILCTMEDFHKFVVEEKDAVLACWRFEKQKAAVEEMATNFELTMRRIEGWCRTSGKIRECWTSPRRDDLLVLMVANSEDVDGSAHAAMTDLELALFDAETPFRLYFLLLRKAEANGLRSFVNPEKAWLIFRGD